MNIFNCVNLFIFLFCRVKNFCGSAGESITAESNVLHLRFYADQIAINSTFGILYTAFRDKAGGCKSKFESKFEFGFDSKSALMASAKPSNWQQMTGVQSTKACPKSWGQSGAKLAPNLSLSVAHLTAGDSCGG